MKKKFYFQGELGAFSEEVGFKFFGTDAIGIPCMEFEDVIKFTLRAKDSFGILPIENSIIGSIHSNYDLIYNSKLYIVGEKYLEIRHHLIGHTGINLFQIKKNISHPAAIQQCKNFLKKLKNVEIEYAYDTAGSVKKIKEQNLIDTAAIASEISASIYKMKILVKNIQDTDNNITRFLILSKKKVLPKKNPKTSIVFALQNVPGSLYKALSVFALREIDLTKIESRPIPNKPFEYYFYLDFKGSLEEKRCKNALNNLKEISTSLKVLGSYEADTF